MRVGAYRDEIPAQWSGVMWFSSQPLGSAPAVMRLVMLSSFVSPISTASCGNPNTSHQANAMLALYPNICRAPTFASKKHELRVCMHGEAIA
jgi:hypothetical protein